MDNTSLHRYFNNIVKLDAKETRAVNNLFTFHTLKKGEMLAEEDKICDSIIYIQTGYFRFFTSQDDNELTTLLAAPDSFITSFAGFLTRTKALESIQAITDVSFFRISYDNLQKLYGENPRFERIGRKIVESYFINKDRRLLSFIRDSAEERYKNLVSENPDYLQHIPLQYIASVLGIKQETLSRIRRRR